MTEHKEQAPEAPKPQKQKKSLWCRIGCVSSTVIFLPVFTLLGLLATQGGQHKLIQWTDALLDELSIEQVEGNLSEGLVLKNLRFQTAGVDTQVAEARLQLAYRLYGGQIFALTIFACKSLPFKLTPRYCHLRKINRTPTAHP